MLAGAAVIAVLLAWAGPVPAEVPSAKTTSFSLTVQHRDQAGRPVSRKVTIDPGKTAVVVVDMWDRHWCKTYTARVANMVPRMNRTLTAARKLGIQVVHAPSDVIGFYKDHPRRAAMLAIKACPAPKRVPVKLPSGPCGRDRCECGPKMLCRGRKAWTRQHKDLTISAGDLIADCNNARELLNLTQTRGIDTLLYMGVASNMCVIHRSCGMIRMKSHGLNVMFLADLVNAITANGADPSTRRPDPNFTPAKGSALVRRHLEKHLAPSLESRQLIDIASPPKDRRPHIVFVLAEMEYKTDKTLPAFAKKYLAKDYRCTLRFARSTEGKGRNDVPGLDALYDADLLVLSMRRRALPVTQMDHLERYIRSGRPIVALRTSVVPFQVKSPPEGHVVWSAFDQEVLGCHYRGYPSKSRKTGSDVWVPDRARKHPIVRDLPTKPFHSASWLYNLTSLGPNTQTLLMGKWSDDQPHQPIALTNTYHGARIFYTQLGHPDDFKIDAFNRLLQNAIHWAVGNDRAKP
jgi:nicotinamidase-related amidase/type 1 glutamine amidotransferase